MSKLFEITESSIWKLNDLHIDSLCRFLTSYSNDRMKNEEVVQDVFVRLWEGRDTLQIESIKTYLYTSARNIMLNRLRDQKRNNTVMEQWAQQEMENRKGEECFDMGEFLSRSQVAINNLPDKCKQIFILSKQSNLTYKQIAEKLDISVKTVETQMGIALRKIRKHLASFYPRL